MAMEPINIFSHRIDPHGVLEVLRRLAPNVAVTGPDDNWQEATITVAGGTLILRHDLDYYDGPDWPRQMQGMRGYFTRFPDSPRKADVLRLIGTFQFALATAWEPDLAPGADLRLPLLIAVAQHLDGVLFTPSTMRDAQGRILIGSDGTSESDAVLPAMPATDPLLDDEEEEFEPPSPQQVARRALALAAVAARALLEQSDPDEPDVEDHRENILAWLDAIGLTDELEPDEWEVLQRPIGRLEERAMIDSTWRLEGLSVLAWALGRIDLPPYDELVDPNALLRSVAFLDDVAAQHLLDHAERRPDAEVHRLRKQLFALHWRLRNFTVEPTDIDFARFAKECWFGPLDISAFRLLDGDLALGLARIDCATPEVFSRSASITIERHMATNWLLHGGVYSRTDVST